MICGRVSVSWIRRSQIACKERKVLSVPAGTSGPNLSSGTQLAATLLVGFGHTLQKLFKPALLFALFRFC